MSRHPAAGQKKMEKMKKTLFIREKHGKMEENPGWRENV